MSLVIYGWEFHQKLQPFEEHAKPQGNSKTFFLVTCGRPEISTCDREIAYEITRRPRDFQHPKLNALFVGKFGRNVLTDNGDQWAKQRKVIASVINERISKAVFNESIRQTDGLLGEVYDHADGRASETNRIFNMMKKITIHVLSGAGMGAQVEWNSNENEKPREGYKMTYIEACKAVIDATAGPIALPTWVMNCWPNFLPGHEFMNNLGQAVKEFPIHTRHLMDRERQRVKTHGGETKSNIMSQLLQASEGDPKAGKALTEEETMGNLYVFTAAGFDTTANTLSYALVLLCRYPQWQDWILEEIDDLLPSESSEPMDYTTIFPKVVRVMAVMLETLRIFTPVIHLSRETKVPQVIETSGGTYNIPTNCAVYIDNVALHLDHDVWANLNKTSTGDCEPADQPDEYAFRPTRWVNPPGSQTPLFQPPKGTYSPWSAGPRVCPGQKMAQVEFTAILMTLFRRHRIEAVPLTINGRAESRSEVDARLDAVMKDSISILTLQMQNVYDVTDDEVDDGKGLRVRLTKRR